MTLSDHAATNRAFWDGMAGEWIEPGRRNWAAAAPHWGIWHVPEADLQALPDVAGKDTVELGCGTAYWSSWLARLGARPVGIDNSERQLATARLLQREFGLEFPLHHASAEEVPLPDASFDVALSEYGASIWCDPGRWIAEAARLLRPGGELVFLVGGSILWLCEPDEGPAGTELIRDWFRPARHEWADDGSVEFQLSPGGWIDVLRRNGFEVLDLIEVQAPADAEPNRFGYVTPEWARQWPSEEIWRARKLP